MESILCRSCNQEKPTTDFYKTHGYKCIPCTKVYMKERRERLNKSSGVFYLDCIGCGMSMRNPQSKVCQKCSRNHEKFDIKTASDFSLPKGDVLACQLAFVIACGGDVLKFFDDIFTAMDAFFEETQREPRVHVNDVDPFAIEKYEEHEDNWYEISILKEPETTVGRKMREELDRRLDDAY